MHNKITFGRRMLDAARDVGMIPEEHFSNNEHTAEDGKFLNILMSDLSQQKRQGMCSISGIHFGHYKAAAKSELCSDFLAKQVTLIARTGHPPKRCPMNTQR